MIGSAGELVSILKSSVLGWKQLCDTESDEAFFWDTVPRIYGRDYLGLAVLGFIMKYIISCVDKE
ncbi:hypothetical protein B5G34_17535 [Flavonifractor sp. An82]|uniref:hypothetical protein n=1 Tax=Flavonifractor sp. An82 TaxID=1965660 RepID=UPI000B369144|nr:hypothetical protein [Flavonifractor sp. An82]OUN19209.1 hypothetical protein B5G34_17535 [Flavonifractor sp. An82]